MKVDDETGLRWAAIPLAALTVTGVATSIANRDWAAATGWAVPATLLVLAVCYLWHRRFEQKVDDRIRAAAQPKEYTADDGEETILA